MVNYQAIKLTKKLVECHEFTMKDGKGLFIIVNHQKRDASSALHFSKKLDEGFYTKYEVKRKLLDEPLKAAVSFTKKNWRNTQRN